MRILMPVSLNGAHGDIHDHCEEIAVSGRKRDAEVVVATSSRPYLERLAARGVDGFLVDFADLEAASEAAARRGPWDLVHTHPFAARKFATRFAAQNELPLVATFHGPYLDDIDTWQNQANALVAVTGSVADRLRGVSGLPADRVHVVENRLRADAMPQQQAKHDPRALVLAVHANLTKDFDPALELLSEFIERASGEQRFGWRIELAGSGANRPDITAQLAKACLAPGAPDVVVHGHLDAAATRELYGRAYAVVAAGRDAIDAIAVGLPAVVAQGTGTYALSPTGDTSTLLYGTDGARVSGAAFHDHCVEIAADAEARQRHAVSGMRLTRSRFNPQALDLALAAIHELAVAEGSRSTPQFRVERAQSAVRVIFAGDPRGSEFAFYVMQGSERLRADWYGANYWLDLRQEEAAAATGVRCFVKDSHGSIQQVMVDLTLGS
ncbi:glycosyltransferase [Promicromonospora kroppenstedtii]|uniref:Glycosyltransferase n=1 Tax=Promicromonospora kroppenstedtii TaxID=440482 RepID=A0ABW7XCQ2_9MICO